MSKLQKLMEQVSRLEEEQRHGLDIEYRLIEGDVDVAEVTVKDREELPIFLTMADDQLLCICYLWGESEVKQDARAQMLEAMLDMNVPMPLSSFAKIDDKYAVFGAMSLSSNAQDVALEIAMLSENAIDAISTLSDYLN
jgi:uncharacterized protein YjfI (DUF2170 family)